ncbi:MAG: hypothetical protein Q7J07_09060 [Pelolinea sp.]|nr:hypothetical protein [Pelolinea sp.]
MANIPFMRAPDLKDTYEVGDSVEAFCDHTKGDQRIKGWLKGTVVQIDAKLIAVQFRTNIYLTDGWMVPDHILWYPEASTQIRKK